MAGKSPGQVGWIDLTVDDAERLSDFYASVIGWQRSACNMGDYNDFMMVPASGGDPVAGVCHARGGNAGLPAVWLPYFMVADVSASFAEAQERGAEVLRPIASMGDQGKWCVLRDPAGATFALFEAPQQPTPNT